MATLPPKTTSAVTTSAVVFPAASLGHRRCGALPDARVPFLRRGLSRGSVSCKAADVSKVVEGGAPPAGEVEKGGGGGGDRGNWVPVVPLAALPKGERRVILQDDETILLLWYKDQVFAIENRSPAEGAYSEGLLNAKLTQRKFNWRSS